MAVASIQDRTSEFKSVLAQAQRKQATSKVSSQRRSLLTDAQKNAANGNADGRPRRSDFARKAAEIGRGISATMGKLEKLAQLAKRRTLFDDRPVEINELTFVIKQDLSSLNQQIGALQTLSKSQHPKADQEGEHNKNVVYLLQGKLTDVSVNFKDVLEERTKNIQASRSRTENFISSVSQHAQPSIQQSASPLYGTPARNSPAPGQDTLSLNPVGDQQLLMMEEAQPTNTYIQQRGEAIEAIEKTISGANPDADNVAANFIKSESFSLDDPVPKTPALNNHGFLDLPRQDQRNFLLLVLLYFLQGIPMGLATGSVPFLLKNHMSYSEIGVFSLASYPYSLKLFWSPFVDAIWSPKIGRRKTWIVPIQFLSGFGMLWLGSHVEDMMASAGKPGGMTAFSFMLWWFFLVLMCATQDIAVDGWALTLLTPGNVSYASTAQTVGLTAGHFMSYTVFLAFNAADFANKWFRAVPSDDGLISLGGYLKFWGWSYIIVTVGLGLLKKEEKSHNEDGVWDVYRIMWGILKLKNVQTIIIVHLIAKIGFQANDGVTNLKLLDKGFGKDNMALTVLIDFPFEIGLGYYAGMWSQKYTPMRLWCWGFMGRLVAALTAQFVVAIFPAEGVTPWYLLVVIAEHLFSTFTNTIMFVAVSAFHARVSDPVIGGTYMTLLATVCNLGGTFPRYFVLQLVDSFTVATCHPGKPGSSDTKSPLITEAFSCAVQSEKERCEAGGGTCEMIHDGYYVVNILCVLFGIATFLWYIKPKVLHLQSLPLRAWRLSPGNEGKR